MSLLLLALYAAYGVMLARRMRWSDDEFSLLPAGAPQLRRSYEATWGVAPPARLPYRLPGCYWLYGWAARVPARWQRGAARALSLALSLPGVAITIAWAEELAGPLAAAAVLATLLSSATLVGSYASASYTGLVASLWMVGLWACWHAQAGLAECCGLALLLLRHTSFWQAIGLVMLLPSPWGVAVFVPGTLILAWAYPAAMGTVFWRGMPPPTLPRDGWAKGLRVFAQRYEPFVGWLVLALLGHGWAAPCAPLAALTLGTLAVTHGQRACWRPKWVIGYLPDFALPVLLLLAVAMAPRLREPWAGGAGALCLAWGLVRRRHPALP